MTQAHGLPPFRDTCGVARTVAGYKIAAGTVARTRTAFCRAQPNPAEGAWPVQGARSPVFVLPPRLKYTVALPVTGFTDFDAKPKK
jgi:hypothetical protein